MGFNFLFAFPLSSCCGNKFFKTTYIHLFPGKNCLREPAPSPGGAWTWILSKITRWGTWEKSWVKYLDHSCMIWP